MDKIPTIIIHSMEIVEKFSNLVGYQKKELVVNVVTKVLDESDIAGDFEPLILQMVPVLIDQFVEVDQGKLKINTKLRKRFQTLMRSIWKLFGACFGNC
jgi:hypothetical protein